MLLIVVSTNNWSSPLLSFSREPMPVSNNNSVFIGKSVLFCWLLKMVFMAILSGRCPSLAFPFIMALLRIILLM